MAWSATKEFDEKLRVAGIRQAVLISDVDYGDIYRKGRAVFRVGNSMILRFERDRGQDFLSLAIASSPNEFYQFGEVEIAMGWRTVDDYVKPWDSPPKSPPDDVDTILARLRAYTPELEDAFSGDRLRFTKVRLADAQERRRAAFMQKLENARPKG
jgi:hypothetical protein